MLELIPFPLHSEGTTKSCLGAVTLNALLHEQDPSNPAFGATFFSRLSTRTGPLWYVSTPSSL